MAIYQTAFSVYIMLLSLTTSGIPFALSRYTAKEYAFASYGNIRFAVKFSNAVLFAVGIFGTLSMFFCADFFAIAMKEPNAAPAIRAVSAAVLFVALGESPKSFYRGRAVQTPTAISQVSEAFVKLAVGYTLALQFSAFSEKYSAAAAIFGVTVGEFVATGVLFLMFIPFACELRHTPRSLPKKEIAGELMQIALPMTLISLVGSALSLAETTVIRNLLTNITFDAFEAECFLKRYSRYTHVFDTILSSGRLSQSGAAWLFGAYSGYAATVFNLPAGILASFGASLFPIATAAYARRDYTRLSGIVSASFSLFAAFCVPISIIMCIFSREILALLFKNTASALILSVMAPSLLVTALSQLASTIMHSCGKIFTPFFYSLLCSIVRIILFCILMPIPQLNICGAPLSSLFAGLLYLALCRIYLKRAGVFSVSLALLIKIMISGAVSVLCAVLVAAPMRSLFHTPAAILVSGSAAVMLVYSAAIFLSGARLNIRALR